MHLGSLFTALASFLQAKHTNGLWFLRIDDLDHGRVAKGAISNILKTLEINGLLWDGAILYQSQQNSCYEQAIVSLQKQSLLYPCSCSRKQLLESNNGQSTIHTDFCLSQTEGKANTSKALRIKTIGKGIQFYDLLQGEVTQSIYSEVGDFILKRQDQAYAYHLATIVDDHFLGITEVLRGIDLINSTPRQIYLQQQLSFTSPSFAHIPILINAQGIKLSKRSMAEAVDNNNPTKTLHTCLGLLGQNPPHILLKATKNELLEWAIHHWNPLRLSGIEQIDCSIGGGIPPLA